MWPAFTKHDNSSQNETIDHISTIAGSLASIGSEHTESPVSVNENFPKPAANSFSILFAGFGWSSLRYGPYWS